MDESNELIETWRLARAVESEQIRQAGAREEREAVVRACRDLIDEFWRDTLPHITSPQADWLGAFFNSFRLKLDSIAAGEHRKEAPGA